jgi:hypothetical protein
VDKSRAGFPKESKLLTRLGFPTESKWPKAADLGWRSETDQAHQTGRAGRKAHRPRMRAVQHVHGRHTTLPRPVRLPIANVSTGNRASCTRSSSQILRLRPNTSCLFPALHRLRNIIRPMPAVAARPLLSKGPLGSESRYPAPSTYAYCPSWPVAQA